MRRRVAMRLPAIGAAILLAILGLLSLPLSAAATTCSWTGAVDTNWANAGNWAGCLGSLPGSADSLVIDRQANQPVLGVGTNITLSALAVNTGAVVQVSGGLTTTDATVGGVLNVQSGGRLFLNTGSATISGTLGVQSGGLAHFDLGNTDAAFMTTGVMSGAGDVLLTNTGTWPGRLFVNGSTNLGGLTLGKYGRAVFNTPTILSRLTLTDPDSSLGGTADVTVTQVMSWTNGRLSMSGCELGSVALANPAERAAQSTGLRACRPKWLHGVGVQSDATYGDRPRHHRYPGGGFHVSAGHDYGCDDG